MSDESEIAASDEELVKALGDAAYDDGINGAEDESPAVAVAYTALTSRLAGLRAMVASEASAAVAAERERCAVVCERFADARQIMAQRLPPDLGMVTMRSVDAARLCADYIRGSAPHPALDGGEDADATRGEVGRG